MSTENTNAELWAVHAQGPDDIYPAYDRADAERHAAELNAIPTPPGISVAAVVVPSPLAPLEHWKGVAELEREHKLHLLAGVAPTDANLSAMRKEGLSLEGDNTYKRDLLDAVVGAMGFGKQRMMPPPAGHWLWRFYDIGVAEADERDKLRAELAELKGGQVMGRVYDGKAELNSIGRQLPDHAELFAAAPAPVQQAEQQLEAVRARELFEQLGQIADDERCIRLLADALAAAPAPVQQAEPDRYASRDYCMGLEQERDFLRGEVERWKESSDESCQKMLVALRELRQLKAQQAEQTPGACACGSNDSSIGYESPQGYWVECGECGYKTEKTHDRSLAILEWDRRNAPSPAAKLVGVPVELLERVAKPVLLRSQEDAHADSCAELRALLATDTAQQQGKA